jgi:ATP-binding cassette subfamily B protein
MNADEIVFIENGKIVEIGNHKSLYGKMGRYRQFYELQFSNNKDEEAEIIV